MLFNENFYANIIIICLILMGILAIYSVFERNQLSEKEYQQRQKEGCDFKYGKDNWVGYTLNGDLICQQKNHPPVIEIE